MKQPLDSLQKNEQAMKKLIKQIESTVYDPNIAKP